MATIDTLSIEVTASADKAARVFDRLASGADKLRDAAKGAADELRDEADAAKDSGETTAYAARQSGAAEKKFREAGDGIANFWKALKNVGTFGKSAFGVISFLPRYFGGQLVSSIKSAGERVGFFFNQIKRVAMYRLIRYAIKFITEGFQQGLKNLYAWSNATNGEFARSMDTLATASQYAGNSIAAMASPLINALAPAIDFITDKFVDFFNLINQIFARLSGATSYTAAKKVASQWDDASNKASGSAKKAANEIKRTLLGFDEINKLNSTNVGSVGGSGGGGKAGVSGASMFETRAIQGSVSNFVDQIRAAFESGNWEALGNTIGKKINDIIGKIDFASIGKKVGYYINGLFTTKYWKLDALNFTNIGENIAKFLNNMIGQIDFNILGRSMVQKQTIIYDTLLGFFLDFDWGQAAGALSNFVIGLNDEIVKWLNKYDWVEIGSTLWQNLKSAISGINFSGLASSFFRLLGTAIRSGAGLLFGFFGNIGNDIKEWWDANIRGRSWDEIARDLLRAIGKGFKNIGQWVFDNIIDPFMSALLGETWDDLKEVAPVAFDVIKKAWDAIVSLPENVLMFFVDVKNEVAQWRNNVKTWWLGKKLEVDEFTTNVKNEASKWWDNLQKWWNGKVGKVKEFTTNIKNDAGEWWENVKKWWATAISGKTVSDFIVEVSNTSSKWWSDIKTYWENATQNLSLGAAAEFVVDVVVKIAGKVWDGITRFWDWLWSGGGKATAGGLQGGSAGIGVYDASVMTDLELRAGLGFDPVNTASDPTMWSLDPGIQNNLDRNPLNVSVDAFPTWSDIYQYLDIDNLRTGVTAFLQKGWEGTALAFMKLKDLSTTVSVGLTVDSSRSRVGLTGGAGGSWRLERMALGGIFSGGSWSSIPQYARGTLNAGSIFAAGEAGPELVGHIGGRTEVLNRSQIASAIYSAVQAAMAPASANFAQAAAYMSNRTDDSAVETMAEMVRVGVEQAMERERDILRQQLETLRQINDKDFSANISTSDINKAQTRANRRAGTTIVPVG